MDTYSFELYDEEVRISASQYLKSMLTILQVMDKDKLFNRALEFKCGGSMGQFMIINNGHTLTDVFPEYTHDSGRWVAVSTPGLPNGEFQMYMEIGSGYNHYTRAYFMGLSALLNQCYTTGVLDSQIGFTIRKAKRDGKIVLYGIIYPGNPEELPTMLIQKLDVLGVTIELHYVLGPDWYMALRGMKTPAVYAKIPVCRSQIGLVGDLWFELSDTSISDMDAVRAELERVIKRGAYRDMVNNSRNTSIA